MFKVRTSLVFILGAVTAACAPSTSSKGQFITCATDPGSGVILSCQPGGGDTGPNTCQDIDEDGDGDPHDHDTNDDSNVARTAGGSDDGSDSESPGDSDHDGIDDDHDCDHQEGEDDDEADLPYDVRLVQGASVTPIHDAFAERGAQPAQILSVKMDGGGSTWRLTELQAGTTFSVTPDDCTHVGNRDVGRDRVIVTWKTTGGRTASDHLDLRYCK